MSKERSTRDTESKRRGIQRTGRALREQIQRSTGRDIGQEAAERRARQAIINTEKKRGE